MQKGSQMGLIAFFSNLSFTNNNCSKIDIIITTKRRNLLLALAHCDVKKMKLFGCLI